MKKKVILLFLISGISAIFFIPVTQQETIRIKAPFLKVYTELIVADNWQQWRPDLKQIWLADSSKISIQKDTNSFKINYANGNLEIKPKGNFFAVNELYNNKNIVYGYGILPGKDPNKTLIIIDKQISLANYLIKTFKPISFADTHIADFKRFMETDSLYYGYYIFKTKVPGNKLIEIKNRILKKNKFEAAAKMVATLKQYMQTNNIKQTQPVILQFLPIVKDSIEVNVGFFINKEVKPDKNGSIIFATMPPGVFYATRFKGKFAQKQKVYNALHQYFTNHLYQIAISPFDTYLDNKLPTSDTDIINIQVNFPSLF